jgi:phosphatidate phosphatase APP1
VSVLQSQQGTKIAAIKPLLAAYPERQFILIGDSGEQDPEIDAQMARVHPSQAVAVCIRNVSDQQTDTPRFQAVRQQLGKTPFLLFDQPDELRPLIERLLNTDGHQE